MVRFGIVGAGGIAKRFCKDIKLVDNAVITAVASRTIDKAEAYKKALGLEHAFSSYSDMAKSDVIDAAYIATPHTFHYELALLFIKNKKHVLVEKPITVNLHQYEELIKAAKTNNVLIMEALWTRFLPAVKYVKSLVDSGKLGDLKKATIEFGHPLALFSSPKKRLMNPDLAGGSLLDLGVYNLSLYNYVKKVPVKTIVASAAFTKTGVDSECDVLITDENDAKIRLRSSMKRFLSNKARLEYSNSCIELKRFFGCQVVSIDGKKITIPYKGDGFVHEIIAFADDIENGLLEDPIMTHEASRESMSYLDQIRKLIKLKYPFE
ncbi:MAG: Gfo/Idh/MocA family protein [Candidatus Izemoplasmatales bacterium]